MKTTILKFNKRGTRRTEAEEKEQRRKKNSPLSTLSLSLLRLNSLCLSLSAIPRKGKQHVSLFLCPFGAPFPFSVRAAEIASYFIASGGEEWEKRKRRKRIGWRLKRKIRAKGKSLAAAKFCRLARDMRVTERKKNSLLSRPSFPPPPPLIILPHPPSIKQARN